VVPTPVIGMALAVGALLTMMLMEGSDPLGVFLLPALVLVLGATSGAVIAGATSGDITRIASWFRQALAPDREERSGELIAFLVDLATQARKEGMLPLEKRVRSIDDPFLRRGLQMAIDGVPIEQLRAVLEGEIAAQRADDRTAAKFFARMGGYAPTIGIIGTIVGLVVVLRTLDRPETIGPLVSAAFVATLWGVLSANFFWLPMSARILRTSDLRTAERELVMAGVVEIVAGVSPRALRVRLRSMLPPSEAQHTAA
jgi:chemotaxis protein MotA